MSALAQLTGTLCVLVSLGMYGTLLLFLTATSMFGQRAFDPSPDRALGRKIFESQCALCHGNSGTGGRGPSLNRPKLNRAPDEAALRKLISDGAEPEMPGAWQLSPHEVASVASFVRSLGTVAPEKIPGNATRGAIAYRARSCSQCHIVAGLGTGFGPELTAIGARRNAAHLREALVRPAAFVPEDFTSIEALPVNGKLVTGIRVNEDSFTVQIKDPSGHFHSLRKDELKSLRLLRDQSAMPAYDKLQPGELDDLVAYLVSLRGEE